MVLQLKLYGFFAEPYIKQDAIIKIYAVFHDQLMTIVKVALSGFDQ